MTSALLAILLAAGDAATRLAPPAGVTCPRDRVTSYTGRVVSYRRTPEALVLTIRTDWATTERVRLAPVRLDQLRLDGAPLADWSPIEASPGHPRPDLRATAWVCEDGRPPVIEWQPPAPPPTSE